MVNTQESQLEKTVNEPISQVDNFLTVNMDDSLVRRIGRYVKEKAIATGESIKRGYDTLNSLVIEEDSFLRRKMRVLSNYLRETVSAPGKYVKGAACITLVAVVLAGGVRVTRANIADINNDGIVNFKDYAIVANDWLKTDPNNPASDINEDGVVDPNDLYILAENWLFNTYNSNFIVQDNIKYYTQTNKSIYNLGENVSMLYRVTNLGSEDVRFDFSDQVQYYFTVKDNGTLIWDAPKVGFPTFSYFVLQQNEYKEFNENWDMLDNQGSLIDPNIYNVTGSLHPVFLIQGDKYVPVSVPINIMINRPPIANAGPDIIAYLDGDYSSCCVCTDIIPGAIVMMNGSNSYDPDGDSLTYIWESGSFLWYQGSLECDPRFIEGINAEGALRFGTNTVTLTVSDGELTGIDSLVVTVLP